MNKQEFIDAIKLVVINDSVKSIESYLSMPPGREPQKHMVELSNWFNNLKTEDKIMAMKMVKESVETSAFGFLCVLDGIRAIEDSKIKGRLILSYEKQGDLVLLNNPDEDYLHDLL